MEPEAAVRRFKGHTMHFSAPPDQVFPLLCPVREHEWLETWKARIVYSESGVAEKGCVFTTEDSPGTESVWAVTAYDPGAGIIGFVVVTPGQVVTTLDIALSADGAGTRAEWRRSFTALSPSGEEAVERLAGPAYDARMTRLERQLDHFLRTGTMLRT